MRQASQPGTALSSLYRSIFAAVHRPPWTAVRYVGITTEWGANEALRPHKVDNVYAPVAPSQVQAQPALYCSLYKALVDELNDCLRWQLCTMFWESYCSATADNINAVGLLLVRRTFSLHAILVCSPAIPSTGWKNHLLILWRLSRAGGNEQHRGQAAGAHQ